VRRLLVVPVLLAAAGLLYALWDPETGIRPWLGLRGEVARAEARVAALRAENETLRERATALSTDPFAIERAIREDLGLALPDEIVVRIREQPSTEPGVPLP
jgi:cell division protein FtsB